MQYARDGREGPLVQASNGPVRSRQYYCPNCGGSVFLRDGEVREPHFAHYGGAGTGECEAYRPGNSVSVRPASELSEVAEPVPAPAPAIAVDVTRRAGGEEDWSLFLHLSELSNEQVATMSADALLDLTLRIESGGEAIQQLTAMDLRPGRGGAFVVLPPSTAPYSVSTSGDWPQRIDPSSYNTTTSGLDPLGTFFRHKRGTWSRARHREAFQLAESVLLLGDSRGITLPPATALQLGVPTAAKGRLWGAWRIAIPYSPSPELRAWFVQRGHPIGEPQLEARLRALPVSIVNTRYQYASDDFILVEASGRSSALTATIAIQGQAPPLARLAVELDSTTRAALVAVHCTDAPNGSYELEVGGRPEPTFDIVQPLGETALRARLSTLPRLCVWIDGEAVPSSGNELLTLPRCSTVPTVKIDAMLPEARVSLVTKTDLRRRVWPSLTAREAELVLAEVLAEERPSWFEVDAGGLGRVRAEVFRRSMSAPIEASPRLARWIESAGTVQQAAHLRERARKAPASARLLRAHTTGAARIRPNCLRRLGGLTRR